MATWDAYRMFLEAVISIFAIVNPVGNLPIFLGLTEDLTSQQRQRLFDLAGLAALATTCVFAILGKFLLEGVFHIAVSEFMFGGGLILIVVGIRGITGMGGQRHGAIAKIPESEQIRIAISPIASPLLVGPGTIVTVMLLVQQHGVFYGIGACLTAFALVMLILHYADFLYKIMGQVVALAVGRIMQIFIVAIGVNFLFRAIKQAFPGMG
jgi:multiple antibiotic resistance protein